jgi:hypothetical protein
MFKDRWSNGLGFDCVGRHGNENVIFAEVLDDPIQPVMRVCSDTKHLELARSFNLMGTDVPLDPGGLSADQIVHLLDTDGEDIE